MCAHISRNNESVSAHSTHNNTNGINTYNYKYTPLLRQLHVVETHNRDITAIRSLYTHCGFLNPVISCPFMVSVMCFMKLK